MVGDEPRDPETPGPDEDESDLARPVAPPSRMRGERGERHLTRRVIAPALLLLVSVPVVAVLFLNLRAVSDRTDSSPASAGTVPTATSSPSASDTTSETPSESPSASPSASPSEEPTEVATPSQSADEPSVESLSTTSGPVAGNQVVTLRGDDLDPVTQVLFGPINASNLEHVSATEIRVTTPAGAAGQVSVVAKAGADDITSAPLRYTYQ